MVEMPQLLKEGLRELDALCKQANEVESQLNVEFMKYGINPDVLKGIGSTKVQTEAFADIVNCTGAVEENIRDIERVFLHYAHREGE